MKRKIIPLLFVGLIIGMYFYFGSSGTRQEERPPVTLAEFNSKIKASDKPVLVYFSASWCTVCGKMKPILADLEKEYAGRIFFFKLDADLDKEVSDEFEIHSLPVILLYNKGNREWVHVGIIDKGTLRNKINPYCI